MANFPSILNTFNRPTPSDRLNSPSHSALHNTVSSALGQVEAVIGVEGASSVVGTLQYLIKSPASDGGGHVQTVNKGGTGQTTYTKGDILVAQSSSVLTKLSVSSVTGNVLQIDPSQAVGIKWGTAGATKVQINTTSVALAVTTDPTTIFSTTIPGSMLGINNAIRFTGLIPVFATGTDVTFITNYGNNVVSSVVVLSSTETSVRGVLNGMIVSNDHPTSQLGFINFTGARHNSNSPKSTYFAESLQGTASVNSSADQTLNIQAKYAVTNNLNSILTGVFVVEKII